MNEKKQTEEKFKSIKAAWDYFDLKVLVSIEAEERLRNEMRKAFYSGAAFIYDFLVSMDVDNKQESEAEIDIIQEEIKTFFKDEKAKKEQREQQAKKVDLLKQDNQKPNEKISYESMIRGVSMAIQSAMLKIGHGATPFSLFIYEERKKGLHMASNTDINFMLPRIKNFIKEMEIKLEHSDQSH